MYSGQTKMKLPDVVCLCKEPSDIRQHITVKETQPLISYVTQYKNQPAVIRTIESKVLC